MAPQLLLTDIGREQMNAIRALSAELMDHEAQNVAANRDELYRTLSTHPMVKMVL